MKLQEDLEDSKRWLVKDDNDRFVGAINQVGPQEWVATHAADGSRLTPVRPGPHNSKDEAFEAFTSALTK